jgi:hypothetical protein
LSFTNVPYSLNFNIVVARRNTELSLETFKHNITLLDMEEWWTKKYYFSPHFVTLNKLIGQLSISRRKKLQTEQHNGTDSLKNVQLNASIVT